MTTFIQSSSKPIEHAQVTVVRRPTPCGAFSEMDRELGVLEVMSSHQLFATLPRMSLRLTCLKISLIECEPPLDTITILLSFAMNSEVLNYLSYWSDNLRWTGVSIQPLREPVRYFINGSPMVDGELSFISAMKTSQPLHHWNTRPWNYFGLFVLAAVISNHNRPIPLLRYLLGCT